MRHYLTNTVAINCLFLFSVFWCLNTWTPRKQTSWGWSRWDDGSDSCRVVRSLAPLPQTTGRRPTLRTCWDRRSGATSRGDGCFDSAFRIVTLLGLPVPLSNRLPTNLPSPSITALSFPGGPLALPHALDSATPLPVGPSGRSRLFLLLRSGRSQGRAPPPRFKGWVGFLALRVCARLRQGPSAPGCGLAVPPGALARPPVLLFPRDLNNLFISRLSTTPATPMGAPSLPISRA